MKTFKSFQLIRVLILLELLNETYYSLLMSIKLKNYWRAKIISS